MKAIPILTLVLMLTPAIAQQPASPAPPVPEEQLQASPAQQAFLNLPLERRQEFAKHVNRAVELFQQKRIFETLDELAKAELIFTESPDLLNIKGSCYVEMRNFEQALAMFKKADQLMPNNPSHEFNIAEVYFVTGEWQKSYDRFTKILKDIPEGNLPLKRLIEFKLLLCLKKLDRHDEAAAMAKQYDFQDDSPFHYYAEAAMAYEANNVVKAEEWVARAARVFGDPAVLAPWQDTLVEYGYIKSFYGEGAGVE
jgi:tetratricopeptide (TPR) repeat protein